MDSLLVYVKNYPLGLSPMSGVTDGPFRRICRKGGAGLLVAPMLAARHLALKPDALPQEQHFQESEHPIGIQLIASEPEEARKAATILLHTAYDFIELNASCPSRRILAMGCGSALLKKPGLIKEILLAIKEGAKGKPLTLKIRLGYRSGDCVAGEIVGQLQGVPLSWITVHGRYADQPFTHPADWDAMRTVVDSSAFPIIGNGGVTNPHEAKRLMQENELLAVLIGRGALGRPWMFAEDCNPGQELKSRMIHEHWQMQIAEYQPLEAVIKFRKHLMWYSRGHNEACAIRRRIPALKDPAQVIDLLKRLNRE